jgi:hypothetical protein
MTREQVRRITGVIDIDTTEVAGEPLGRIGGIAFRNDRSALVVDELANRIYEVLNNAALSFAFGRSGDGPGELRRPCCPRLGPGNQLWVLSPGGQRVDGFRLGSGRVISVDRRVVRQGAYLRLVPPALLPNGQIAVTVAQMGKDFLSTTYTVVTFAADGSIVNRHALPQTPRDSVDAVVSTHPSGQTLTRPVPFGASHWLAQSGDGSYARAITSRYDIMHYERDGKIRHRITRDVRGTQLTSAERASAERELNQLKQMVGRSGGSVPDVHIPRNKPPIKELWFDEDGRLWVELYERSVEGLRQADVFSPTGQFSFVAQWPANVDLRRGAVSQLSAWGVRSGDLGEHHLVRLHFS